MAVESKRVDATRLAGGASRHLVLLRSHCRETGGRTAISRAVRGTPNRHCGIAAATRAEDALRSAVAVTRRGNSPGPWRKFRESKVRLDFVVAADNVRLGDPEKSSLTLLCSSLDIIPTSRYGKGQLAGMPMKAAESQHESKVRLLDASLYVIRAKGYSATRIEDICEAANLTKGSFFHHFKSKEDLALAAAAHFAAFADAAFASAPYQNATDPLDRLLGYVDFRIAILQGSLPDYTCLLGTMVQETFDTHPAIRAACDTHISAHAAAVAKDIAQARRRYAPHAPWSAESLALYTQAVIQGAFILAKARQGPQVAADCLQHLRRYLETQLVRTPNKERDPCPPSRKSPRSSGSTATPKRR